MSVRKQPTDCQVSGCNERAVVQVYWRKEFPALRYTYYKPYWQCSHMCEQHMLINESGRTVNGNCPGVTAYPFVNRAAYVEGQCMYERLDNGDEIDVDKLPHVQVDPALMPPPLDPHHPLYRLFHQIVNAVYMLGNPKLVDKWHKRMAACA